MKYDIFKSKLFRGRSVMEFTDRGRAVSRLAKSADQRADPDIETRKEGIARRNTMRVLTKHIIETQTGYGQFVYVQCCIQGNP